MENEKWKMEDGRWKTEDGRWKMGRLGRQIENALALLPFTPDFCSNCIEATPRIKRATLPGKNIRHARAEKTQQQRNH
jgi:hypothetical protein